MSDNDATQPPPTYATAADLDACRFSAAFWARELPKWGADLQQEANRAAVLSAVLSAVTGLAVWTTLSQSTQPFAQAVVCVVAFATALLTSLPKIFKWDDKIKAIPGIVGNYVADLGWLNRAAEEQAKNSAEAEVMIKEAMAAFRKNKQEKDALGVPRNLLVKKDAEYQAYVSTHKPAVTPTGQPFTFTPA